MSSKIEWKPGDVALAEAGCWANRKVALRLDEGWAHTNGVNVDGDGIVTPVRPLAVIDPEDRETVRAIADAAYPEGRANTNRLQAALREFANPKPEEPTGLGAVVEDAEGQHWVRADIGGSPWIRPCDDWQSWSDLAAVRVLSEGVTA